MKRNWMKLATVAALAAGIALAQAPVTNPPTQPTHRQGAARGKARRHMFQALNLTDGQKQQAKSIFAEARKSTEPLRLQLQQNRQALTAATKANDRGQIESLSKSSGDLRGQLKAARTQTMAQFFQILTPEQRAKAEKMQVRMQQRSEHHAHRGNVG
jgi:Spy/CpxP family protein refolding chaperone